MRNGFPGLRFVIDDMVSCKNKVAIRWTMYGTHLGELFGLAASGKKVNVNQFQIERVENGQIVEHWRQSDDMGMLKQLGQIASWSKQRTIIGD